MTTRWLALLISCLTALSLNAHSSSSLETHFQQLKRDPKKLLDFITAMPKGGDLHNHMPGATYAENLLRYSKNDKACLDKTFSYHTCPAIYPIFPSIRFASWRRHVVDTWSMDHFHGTTQQSHDHFFSTFNKFWPLMRNHRAEVLAELMQRAGTQHESYLELMLTPDDNQSAALGDKTDATMPLDAQHRQLLEKGIPKLAAKTIKKMSALEKKSRKILNCHQLSSKPACRVQVRYLYQVLREQPQNNIFAQLLFGFELVSRDPRFVGINMVMPEEGAIALKDYDAHMNMIAYLHQHYPKVHIALHAGELTPRIVGKLDLRFHIKHAVEIAHAERIGHGIDIQQEDSALATVDEMAKKHIAVEINLTSNSTLLGINHHHPFTFYQQHHVPMVISTDDEGVLRTNISKEYLQAVQRFDLSWAALKQLNRNSLTYSFLPGDSLWQNPDTLRTVEACHNSPSWPAKLSQRCRQFLEENLKAKIQWQLEMALVNFENKHL